MKFFFEIIYLALPLLVIAMVGRGDETFVVKSSIDVGGNVELDEYEANI